MSLSLSISKSDSIKYVDAERVTPKITLRAMVIPRPAVSPFGGERDDWLRILVVDELFWVVGCLCKEQFSPSLDLFALAPQTKMPHTSRIHCPDVGYLPPLFGPLTKHLMAASAATFILAHCRFLFHSTFPSKSAPQPSLPGLQHRTRGASPHIRIAIPMQDISTSVCVYASCPQLPQLPSSETLVAEVMDDALS